MLSLDLFYPMALNGFTGRGNRISLVLALVFFTISMSEIVHHYAPGFEISSLLSCMMMGAIFTNMTKESIIDKVMYLIESNATDFYYVFCD